MPNQPIDPLASPRYALEGKVVTMDANFKVLAKGVVYIDAGKIAAVLPTEADPPAGFEDSPLIKTGGTIFPGMIELHNHLSYNILPMWDVPKRYSNRGQWGRHPDYRKLISGPMNVLGRTAGFVEAIVRYVECKCLMGGVTTSQGISLFSNNGIKKYYRGLIRNVEKTDDPSLPAAASKISDVDSKDAEKFLKRLKQKEGKSALILHLAEGLDERAHKHFEALQMPDGKWAITDALAGIHSAGLHPQDFKILQQHGGSMVWSPLSNYLLYGGTAQIRAAKEAGVLIGIGSDWSPSGSKNLLGELKVATLVSKELDDLFSLEEIVAMATINAAKILKWDSELGSIEQDKRADLMVVNGRSGDPYQRLIGSKKSSKETSISLVVINGVPRYGRSRFMNRFGGGTEKIEVGKSKRVFNLAQETANEVVGLLTLKDAESKLKEGLANLANMAKPLEDPLNALLLGGLDTPSDTPWRLELDHDEVGGESSRPHLPLGADGDLTAMFEPVAASVPLSELLVPLSLDPLTVVDDRNFFKRIARQPNLPDFIKVGLAPMYGQKPRLPDSAEFVERLNPVIRPAFAATVELSTFLRTDGRLSLADRRLLVEQALVMLEQTYVHLPLKRAMHAVDPIQRLKLVKYRLGQVGADEELEPEIEFHREMTAIFTSVRDLHTNYLLPDPFKDRTAFLPFFIEEYYQDGEPKYMVSKVIGGAGPESFKKGVEVLYWNGIPIKDAVEINAERQAGSNPAARHGRGLDALTFRPMLRVLPPQAEWVRLVYRNEAGEEEEFKQNWLVFTSGTGAGDIDPDEGSELAAALGYDLQTNAIQHVKKLFFAPSEFLEAEQDPSAAAAISAEVDATQGVVSTMPTVFRAEDKITQHGTFGYIRIFTFNVPDADDFVAEFVRLAGHLSQEGLILDVRGNGGGLIYAAERLLQVLTPHQIEPQRTQFINTPLVLDICRRHADAPLSPGLNLQPWIDSIARSVQTGATYSLGFPITNPASCNQVGQKYFGPVVLVTDSLCYSATDIFAAGFRDHDIGLILGASENTGAGGANVWTHRLLQILMSDLQPPFIPTPDSPFQPLPNNAGMRVSIRRTLRVKERAGVPVEDLGVVPDFVSKLTKNDLLDGNRDLIDKAGEILKSGKVYGFSVEVNPGLEGALDVEVITKNIDRLDFYLDDRPLESLEVAQDITEVELQAGEAAELVVYGYDHNQLAAASRHALG